MSRSLPKTDRRPEREMTGRQKDRQTDRKKQNKDKQTEHFS